MKLSEHSTAISLIDLRHTLLHSIKKIEQYQEFELRTSYDVYLFRSCDKRLVRHLLLAIQQTITEIEIDLKKLGMDIDV